MGIHLKQYATTLIIWASLIIGELHTLWENSKVSENWIITKYVPMPVQWNVKYVTDEIWFIMMGVAIYLFIPNRINRTTVKSYTLFCAWDLVMYFYNYKQAGYEAIYTYLLIAWIIIYNRNGNSTSNRQGNLITA